MSKVEEESLRKYLFHFVLKILIGNNGLWDQAKDKIQD